MVVIEILDTGLFQGKVVICHLVLEMRVLSSKAAPHLLSVILNLSLILYHASLVMLTLNVDLVLVHAMNIGSRR